LQQSQLESSAEIEAKKWLEQKTKVK
jgi:hypothetical protein